MIKLMVEEKKMRRISTFIIIICTVVCLIWFNYSNEPKIISNITTLDTSYITILMDKRSLRNTKNLEEKVLQSIKIYTKDKEFPENLYISIYAGKRNLKEGKEYMEFVYKKGD